MYIVFLINRILSQLNLEWTGTDLVYTFHLFGGHVKYKIETTFEEVLEFLGIELTRPLHDITTSYEHLEVIKDCLYMNTDPFYNEKIEEDNQRLLSFLDDFQYRLMLSYREGDNKIPSEYDMLTVIDTFFDTELLDVSKEFDIHSLRSDKDKFNGKLLMSWNKELKPGKLLRETIGEFKEYIEKSNEMIFTNWLKITSHKDVKNTFVWFSKVSFPFDIDEGDMPF